MANTFSFTNFVSKTLGTFLENHSNVLSVSYRGVEEFNKATGAGYAPGDTVDIKIPGYPTVQTGLAVTAEDITDRTVPYTLKEEDIYNVTYQIDIQSIGIDVVGGELAFSGNPYRNPNNDKEINPQAKTLIDNYVFPAGEVINGKIETVIMDKLKAAAFYTPIDLPSKLQVINKYANVSGVRTLMNNLGFMNRRYAFMNEGDYEGVANSLQNMFNEPINRNITQTGAYGEKTLADFIFTAANTISNTDESPQYAANPSSTGVTVSAISPDGSTITLSGVIVTAGLVLNAGTLVAIPAVKLLNKVTKIALETTFVGVVAADAVGDNAGNVTFTLSEPVVAAGMQANVNILPAPADAALIFPAHRNNYFFVPMGVVANPVKLGRIAGADNNRYQNAAKNMDITAYIQGLVTSGANTFRMSCQCPTLAIPSYVVNLPSVIPS